MKSELLVCLSDLDKASTEARRYGNEFLNNALLLRPDGFAKKGGLRKPRMEVIVPAFRQERLGSSQPIVAARLVLIRTLDNPKPAASSILWMK